LIPKLRSLSDLSGRPVVLVGAGDTGAFFVEVSRRDPRLQILGVIDREKKGVLEGVPIYSYEEAFQKFNFSEVILLIAGQQSEDIAASLLALGARHVLNGHPWAMARMYEPTSGTGELETDLQALRNTIRRLQRRHAWSECHFREQMDARMKEYEAEKARVAAARSYDISPLEWELIGDLRPLAATSLESLVSTIRATQYVIDTNVPGAILECGVFHGAQVALMQRVLLHNGVRDREIYAYDTFNGMPEPGTEDVVTQVSEAVDSPSPGTPAKTIWETMRDAEGKGSTWVNASIQAVRSLLDSTGYPMERVHLIEGMVEDTLPSHAPETIALMRLDTDFYQSTKHELVCLYPRLSPRGILMVDDYGAFAGSRQATDEYFRENGGAAPHLVRIDPTVRVAVKPGVL